MNRGLGRIERAILNLIENEGDVHGPEDLQHVPIIVVHSLHA